MKLSFKYYPKLNDKQEIIINELSFHTSKLYNIANYELHNGSSSDYYKMEKQFKSNWHNEYLHSHNYQQALKVLSQNWKAYFNANKNYKESPHKYKGQPRPPQYKNTNNNKNEVIFTNLAIREIDGLIKLSLTKKVQSKFNVNSLNFELPTQVQKHINMDRIQQIRLAWDNFKKSWYLIFIYKEEECILDDSYTDTMAIDIGLNNLCAITFLNNGQQIIIDGKRIKSKNSYFNKEISKLSSLNMKRLKDSSRHKSTKRINTLYNQRDNYVTDYIHKTSYKVIELAINNKCNKIVLGDLKNIKYKNKIKSFVQIPIARLVDQIKYKARLKGIEVVTVTEEYTSLTSSLDLEPIKKSKTYLGKRVTRGLYKSKDGILINADINGSLNILRKHIKDKCTPRLVDLARDNGYVSNPTKLLVS